MKTHLLLAVALLAAGAFGAAACGGSVSSADKTATAEIILDETAVPTLPPPTQEAQGDTGGDTNTGGDNGGGDASGGAPSTLDLVGKNTVLDKTKLEAAAGEITIEFDNQDPGIAHNIAVYESADAANAGESPIAATPLEVGPKKQTLKVTLETAEYFFRCDSHPSTMAGTLTVK